MTIPRRDNRSRVRALLDSGSDDTAPELSLLNLVDLMLVFAVGLMLAIVSYYGLGRLLLEPDAVAVVRTAGSDEMEVIVKKPDRVERMRMTQKSIDGQGVRIGIAYRLDSGEIVYVPENAAPAGEPGENEAPIEQRTAPASP